MDIMIGMVVTVNGVIQDFMRELQLLLIKKNIIFAPITALKMSNCYIVC